MMKITGLTFQNNPIYHLLPLTNYHNHTKEILFFLIENADCDLHNNSAFILDNKYLIIYDEDSVKEVRDAAKKIKKIINFPKTLGKIIKTSINKFHI